MTDMIFLGVPRSPHWDACRHDHLRIEPACAITGIDDPKRLNVHHIEPYYKAPEKELDQSNLITLAEKPWNIHYLIGHGGLSWLDWNPHIRAQVKRLRAMWKMLNGGMRRDGG